MTKNESYQRMKVHLEMLAADLEGRVGAEECGTIAAGDVVQLRPDVSEVLGGTLLRVTRVGPYRIEGYLLTAHRGGCREAWYGFPPSCVVRMGSIPFPESAWSRRVFERGPAETQKALDAMPQATEGGSDGH
jgi:hypothetical protein